MKRVWGRVAAGLSLLGGAGVTFSACVHDDSTIFVRNVLASQLVTSGMSCAFTNDPAQVSESTGILDIALKLQYDGVFLVGNQMVAQANSSQLQTETSTVTIQGAIVRITKSSGDQLNTFTRLTSATLAPATGSVPGYAPVFVTIIDPNTIETDPDIQQNIAGVPPQPGYIRLVTYVRFFGKSLGGQSIESNEFEFPVDVCNGCLINYSNDPHFPIPNCVGSGTATSQPQVPCYVGQDLGVDCSACQGSNRGCRGAFQVTPGAVDAGTE